MFNMFADLKFACLDTETTGLSPIGGGKVCEIAVSVSKDGQTVEEFSTLLNPGLPMSPEVIAIHGITNKMVAGAPSFGDIAPQLLGLLDGCVLVAHNAEFDLSFLRAELESCGFRLPEYPVLDTLKFARKNARFAKNNLGFIATQLGIDCQGAHRALADVKMTQQIFYYFLNQFAQKGISSLEELQKCQLRRIAELPGSVGQVQFI